mmetsp:Transcript_124910/g.249413  ORF Transcript_124910/g.249413 Transcript_124910/m.249413 type:complete len:148 (-) Transcript_124910:211-654(-)|eukprot:CAMPEP_0172669404 /NCGR_PEP_ID=MMETSP1074-20121228/9658_1 /TAXON_ID=2916 /ORGANISM="Ceratium fusus, Strain PA161109" /LENGTH=147 /DNA_ID=CAMNT_0013486173 /DNA_START=68 /DNA_END=511 /DNA_ORIENTATION=+
MPRTNKVDPIAKGAEQMNHIMRKASELEKRHSRNTKLKEDAVNKLIASQEAFDLREQEVQECHAEYERACADLEERIRRRDQIQAELSKHSEEMKQLVAATSQQQRLAAARVKSLSASFHGAELTAERGYSRSVQTTSPRAQTNHPA